MRNAWRSVLILLCACKAEIGGQAGDPDGATPDTAVDAAVDAVGTFGPWMAPSLVPGAMSAVSEDDGTLSNSKLELVFALSDPAIDGGNKHLYYISRATVTSTTWTAPVRLSFNLDTFSDETPRFSADDKTLYFGSSRTGTTGALDIWQVSRPNVGVPTGWGAVTQVAGVNSTAVDKWCMPCSQNRYIMISSRAPSTTDDIWEGVVGQAPTLSTLADAASSDTGALLSADCLTAYFASTRSGVNRIYKATRTSVTSAWSPPQMVMDFLTGVPATVNQDDPWISPDQRTFVFSSNLAGDKDIYITTR